MVPFSDCTRTAAIWLPRAENLLVLDRVKVLSCYLTPTDNIGVIRTKTDAKSNQIVAGDFKSKFIECGMLTTSLRGIRVLSFRSMMFEVIRKFVCMSILCSLRRTSLGCQLAL